MSDRTCAVPECEKAARARGWCHTHYCRWYRTGTTDERQGPGHDDDLKRFFAKFKVGPMGSCWIWQGTVVATYGHFSVRGKRILAHRYAYEIWIGTIPEGLQIDHVHARGCRSRLCVNPFHLEPVTQQVNAQRGSNGRKTHCPQGHPYSGENLVMKSGARACRECRSQANRIWKQRRLEARKRAA